MEYQHLCLDRANSSKSIRQQRVKPGHVPYMPYKRKRGQSKMMCQMKHQTAKNKRWVVERINSWHNKFRKLFTNHILIFLETCQVMFSIMVILLMFCLLHPFSPDIMMMLFMICINYIINWLSLSNKVISLIEKITCHFCRKFHSVYSKDI
jgi:hypothetical protein